MVQDAKWTWLVYMAGDNNLEGAGRADLAEMKKAGSTEDVNILVQFDTTQKKTTRYRIEKGDLKVLQEMPGINCGDPATLTEFIRWGTKNYPARHYFLDVWNHGGGWENLPEDSGYSPHGNRGALLSTRKKHLQRSLFRSTINNIYDRPPKNRYIALDDDSRDYLDNQELRKAVTSALPGGRKLDILGCDACLMNMLEIAYEMKDTAGFMVGSEETEPDTGWPYDTIIKALLKKPDMPAEDLAKTIPRVYGRYYTGTGDNVTQSAFDLAKVRDTAAAVSALADALIAALGDTANLRNTAKSISFARENSLKFYNPNYLDLGDFAAQISAEFSGNTAIKKASAGVIASLNGPGNSKLVIQNNTCGYDPKKATGISVYFPARDKYSEDYESLLLSREYHWKDFLTTYLQKILAI